MSLHNLIERKDAAVADDGGATGQVFCIPSTPTPLSFRIKMKELTKSCNVVMNCSACCYCLKAWKEKEGSEVEHYSSFREKICVGMQAVNEHFNEKGWRWGIAPS